MRVDSAKVASGRLKMKSPHATVPPTVPASSRPSAAFKSERSSARADSRRIIPQIRGSRAFSWRRCPLYDLRCGWNERNSIADPDWLPFLDTYRTMCLAPSSGFRQLLKELGDPRFVLTYAI